MTTTAAVEQPGGHPGENKEKAEKRRALGRGLESLLPRPRVVVATEPSASGTNASAASNAEGEAKSAAHGPVTVRTAPLPMAATAVIETMHAVAEGTEFKPAADANESISIMAQAETRIPGNLVIQLAISDIDKNPFQTRYVGSDDAMEELANSIKVSGVLQPIVVRPAEDEKRYILILGERRLHASKMAGKETIPAVVRRVSEQQAAEMTIIENLQREDLSPLEQAEAFRVLSQEFRLTQQQIGERVGLSRESVANYMRLLKLPREVMQLLAEKKIKFAEAKELLKLENNDQIAQGALYAVKKGLSLEQIERMVMSMTGLLEPFPGMPGQVVKKTATARWVDPNVRAAQMELERLLGMRVRIRDRKGKGKIVIEYSNVDDYERVVEALRAKK
jgi:ParB family chromosome partitioning protein